MRFLKRHAPIIVPLLLFFSFLGLRLGLPEFVEGLQLKVFDIYQNIKPRVYRDAPVAIIDIDDVSLAKIGQWPWSRNVIAELITNLHEAQAAVVAFDIVFAEKDRTSPDAMLAAWPEASQAEAIRRVMGKSVDYDRSLAQAMQDGSVVTAFSLTNRENDVKPAHKSGFAFAGDNPEKFLPLFRGAVINLLEIEKAAKGNGSFNIIAEHDGVLRRIPLLFSLQGDLYPSLALEALRVAQGASNLVIKSTGSSGEVSFGENTGIVEIKAGVFVIPSDAEGRMWLYDTGNVKARFIPAWQVLEKKMGPDAVAGKIIFIGTSAEGLKDIRTTPLNPVAPGVEVHAQLLEQILNGEFLKRPDWATGAEFLYLMALGFLLILLMHFIGALWCAVIGLIAIIGAFAFSWAAFVKFHLLFDAVMPSVAALVIYLSASLLHYLRSESERREIRNAFAHYMSPALVEQLAKNPAQLKLGGEIKNMTLLFADVRDFTGISECLSAQELTWFLNRFLTPMTDVILSHGGTIDKYMGDNVMAFWNAPLDDPEHARHACEAALEMKQRLKILNEAMSQESKVKGKELPQIQIGIGISTGDCCVGNLGSEQRFDYSALGDTVNLASRLEGLCKIYGAGIIVGESTAHDLKGFALLEIDLIQVKGKTKPVRIFALLGDETKVRDENFQTLVSKQHAMLEAYRRQDWDEAEEFIRNCTVLCGSSNWLENYYRLIRERIWYYREHPPAADWDGVFIALTK